MSAKPAPTSPELARQWLRLAILSATLIACFALPLAALARFAIHSDLYSYILLVPFISIYFAWLRKEDLHQISEPPRILGVFFLATGLLVITGYGLARHEGLKMDPADSLAWTTFSFTVLFAAACFLCLGIQTLRALAFPIGFLVFMVPFPVVVQSAVEYFLQHISAVAAELLFNIVGTPLIRQDVTLQLPGLTLQVATECSGIRSSLVLLITSLVAGCLFLRSPWKRAILALAVIPLGILRNAFRIVTIGELCIHVDPAYIDSPIHHRGGPIFFVISMFPFLLLLYYLRKTDEHKHAA